ncbi:ankyrin repeat domain-containing protein [Aspergillus mulundensis]|uniref:Uncharacterized protein n=1 Tax=Aspergillus mulundensis TaxID=1810919 RepID=A0A3D8RAG2_9EURO|nr:Uncharacterized protein DSM5745_08409 [Aspergillus mulundensis]RDW70898.1 Uncharacterized protein DSM5745_08409 [Aspergillus mulundensis]
MSSFWNRQLNGTVSVNFTYNMPKPILQKSKTDPVHADGDVDGIEPGDLEPEDRPSAEAPTPPRIILVEPHDQSEADGSLAPEQTAVIKPSPEHVLKNNLLHKFAASTPPAKEAKEKLLVAAETLIANGASLECTDDSGRTPLHRACASGTRDMIALLLRHGPKLKEACDNRGNTPLHVICGERKGSGLDLALAVCLLVDAKVNLNSVNEDGVTALHLIAERAEEDWTGVVEFLLQKGAEVGLRDKSGKTALHKAVVAGSAELVEMLIQNGATVDEVDDLGHSALHLCVVSESLEAMEVLLRCDADVNLRDGRGHTVLHLAAQYGWTDAVEPLLESGADVTIKDEDGLTPMQVAKEEGAEGVAELLRLRDGSSSKQSSKPPSVHYVRPADGEHELATQHTAEKKGKGRDEEDKSSEWSQDERTDDIRRMGRERVNSREKERKDSDSDWSEDDMEDRTRGRRRDRVDDHVHDSEDSTDEEEDKMEESTQTPNNETTETTNDTSNDETKETSSEHMIERTTTGNELTIRDAMTMEGTTNEVNGDIDQNISIQAHHNLWAGVQRDNGDGFILASYDNHDISFDAKLESIRPILHEGKDMHEIQVKLNFMRPYSMDHRIRYARVDVNLSAGGGDAPNIRAIMPQADRMEVSEQEITSGKTFTVGASGSGGPSNVNISMEGSKSKKSTFKGVRIIHGAIRDRMHASWRLYEEPGSRSGLPEIVRLLLLVHCEAEFNVQLALSVKACHFLTFGIPRTLTAPKGASYTVPKLNIITAYEHNSRLRQMLDVADRAATTIEETHRLEELFARAMRVHKKRHLIMGAGSDEAHLHEWNEILDDARTSDFTTLRYKLLEMEEADKLKLELERRKEKEREVKRELERLKDIRREEERFLERDRPSSWTEPRRERERDRPFWPGRDSYQSDSGSPPPPRPRARPRASSVYYDDSPEVFMRRHRRAATRDYGYDERAILRGRDHAPITRNPLDNFTAVGPGYHVSRLA